MRTRFGVSALAVGIIGALCAAFFALIAGQVSSPRPVAAQSSAPPAATAIRRQASGKPDFSGIWQANNTANWDLVTHEAMPARVMQTGVQGLSPVPAAPMLALGAVGGVPPGVGVVEGDVIPYKPEALQKKKDNFEHWLDRDPEIKCYQPGVPRAMYMPYPFQILHGTNKIMMV